MKKPEYPYPYSFNEAKRLGKYDVEAYKVSKRLNTSCAQAIESAVERNYNGMRLEVEEAVKEVVDAYGYDRVFFVLANTLQRLEHDGRISDENKKWAKAYFISDDKTIEGYDFRTDYIVSSHSGLLDMFTTQMRKIYSCCNLYGKEHCIPIKDLDFTNKLMVLNPDFLCMNYKKPEYQLVFCTDGFGCLPSARGRKVFGQFLLDGENCQFLRQDFLGELKEEYIPQWAKEKMRELLF